MPKPPLHPLPSSHHSHRPQLSKTKTRTKLLRQVIHIKLRVNRPDITVQNTRWFALHLERLGVAVSGSLLVVHLRRRDVVEVKVSWGGPVLRLSLGILTSHRRRLLKMHLTPTTTIIPTSYTPHPSHTRPINLHHRPPIPPLPLLPLSLKLAHLPFQKPHLLHELQTQQLSKLITLEANPAALRNDIEVLAERKTRADVAFCGCAEVQTEAAGGFVVVEVGCWGDGADCLEVLAGTENGGGGGLTFGEVWRHMLDGTTLSCSEDGNCRLELMMVRGREEEGSWGRIIYPTTMAGEFSLCSCRSL